jgi:hypothetical protein
MAFDKAQKLADHYWKVVLREARMKRLQELPSRGLAESTVRTVLESDTKVLNKAYAAYRLRRGKGAQTLNAWIYSQQIKAVEILAHEHVERMR